MSVRIITDSACDIPADQANAMGIELLPLTVVFGKEEYLDGQTLSCEKFYEKLIETDELPHTCQISPFRYEEAFEKVREQGDEAVCITISSKLSGSFNSAQVAHARFPCGIRLVDSRNVCIGQQILVLLAVRLRDRGKSADEIAEELERRKGEIRVLGLLDTLEYLKKGGRISPAVAFAGSLLSVKPVIAVEDGEVSLIGKARGSKNGNNLLKTYVEKSGGIDFSMPYALAYSGLSDSLLQKYIADSAALYEQHADCLPVCRIGCAIGTHVGPGTVAVAFYRKL